MWRNRVFKKNFLLYAQLMRLHRPIGILLLLWPTLWALWIASNGHPNSVILGIFILGTIIMRSAGCIINDIADRNFDAHVERTSERPLATKKISVKEAIILFIILCLLAFALVLLLNPFTIMLAFAGVGLAIIYPFLKRFTHLPQLALGFAFSWGIPMAFAAQTNTVPLIGWWLFITALLWPIIYDTMYALADKADDLKIGVKSTAILFGNYNKIILGILQIIFLISLFFIGQQLPTNIFFNFSLIITAALFIYQQYLIKNQEPQNCFKAFLNNNWVGLSIFSGIFFSYLHLLNSFLTKS